MLEHGHIGYSLIDWPEAYADLLPALREDWGVSGDIHMIRQLGGGKSGALVFAVDITTADYSGQAILKLDRSRSAEEEERNEAGRHMKAFETTPDYAAKHLPRVLQMTSKGEQLAILSSIAEVGLEYSAPWFDLDYDTQLETAKTVSRDILEKWNAEYVLSDRLVMPQAILHDWMGYRLDPEESRIFAFLDHRGQSRAHAQFGPQDPSFMFDGTWFPNPLAFALSEDLPQRLQLRAAMGCHHGDLHGDNVLISKAAKRRSHYYLIDLAFYEPQQYLFYDHAYFELAYLLRVRKKTSAQDWLAILDRLEEPDSDHKRPSLSADDVGPTGLLRAWRKAWWDWMQRQEGGRRSFMESQMLLARVATGLTFTHRQLPEASRHMAFVYAAHCLKAYLTLNGLDWPHSGPAYERGFEFDEAAVSPPEPKAEAQAHDAATAVERRRPASARLSDGDPSSDIGDSGGLYEKLVVELIPFDYLGDGEDRERLADGLCMELMSRMSRIDWIGVVPAPSGKSLRSLPIPERKSSTGYLITGSIRRSDDHLRVMAYLIDGMTDECVWSKQYDRKAGDIIALQDEISDDIVAHLDSELKSSELKRVRSQEQPTGLWNMFQRGRLHFFSDPIDGGNAAIDLFKKVVDIDVSFAPAHAFLAFSELRNVSIGCSEQPEQRIEKAREHAQNALTANSGSSVSHVAMGRVCTMAGEFDQADWEIQRAIELNPNSAAAYLSLAGLKQWQGDAKGALACVSQPSRFSTVGPIVQVQMLLEAGNRYFLGDFEKAHSVVRGAVVGRIAGPIGYEVLAVCRLRCGLEEDAKAAMAKAVQMAPQLSISTARRCWNALDSNMKDRILGDFQACGMPEGTDSGKKSKKA